MIEQLLITNADPVIHHHRVFGRALMPGLAYIDLVFQLFHDRGETLQCLVLRDFTIYRPLVASETVNVLLEIEVNEIHPGRWSLVAVGRRSASGEPSGEPVRYFTAAVERTEANAFGGRLNLQEVAASARARYPLETTYSQCRVRGLVHSGLMKPEGTVYEGDGAQHVSVTVESGQNPAEEFLFHPGLLDACGVGARTLLPPDVYEGETLILPFSFESFRASHAITRACTARIRRGTGRESGDLVFLDLEFFDTAGNQVAELRRFANKRVREPALISGDASTMERTTGVGAIRVASAPSASPERVGHFLRLRIAERLGRSVDAVPVDSGYYELGLDSVNLLEITRDLETEVGEPLPPTLLFEYTTVNELSQYLSRRYPTRFQDPAETVVIPPQATPSVADATTGSSKRMGTAETVQPTSAESWSASDIAVIGMAGRYPAAANVREFWRNLVEGRDCVTEIPADRWDWREWTDLRSPSGKPISKWGGFIDSPDCFDADFFRIAPREAAAMDPQERVFLQVCWSAIEDAGYTPETLRPARGPNHRFDVGVFAGVMHQDYALLGAENGRRGERQPLSLNSSSIANRVSYCCNFHGPSLVVDTACSSSLTAVHLAVESLRTGASRVAIAGGVNLALHPLKYVTYGLMDMQSSDGRCRAFGEGGTGYVSGEGAGAVVLKPLKEAMADGDTVYAVIRGSSLNHTGKASGLTVPHPVAQAEVVAAAWQDAGIDPRTITCMEAHGTGTSLGDPIEIEGLTRAFRGSTADTGFCALGSVKSNIGHAESAAGISGLTKLILQLHQKTLVPSLHAEVENPRLQLRESPFVIPHASRPWIPDLPAGLAFQRRRGGISSFGASGSNVHLVLEEAPDARVEGVVVGVPQRCLVPLSARNAERLAAMAAELHEFLGAEGDSIALIDLAHTFQVGRRAMEERVAFVAASLAELRDQLRRVIAGQRMIPGVVRGDLTLGSASSATDPIELAAREWVCGSTVDWTALYPQPSPARRRVRVPTYPFAKVRHWLTRSVGDGDASRASRVEDRPPSAPSVPVPSTLYFVPEWKVAEVSSTASRTSTVGTQVRLFVATENRRILEVLRASGLADQVSSLIPDRDPAEFIERATLELLEEVQQRLAEETGRGTRIVVCAPLTRSGFPFGALMGLLRSVAAESVRLQTQLILDAALESGDGEKLVDHLRQELLATETPSEVAFGPGGERRVLGLREWRTASLGDESGRHVSRLRRDGVYWITGGLGGLGLIVARYLALHLRARVVLSGRSLLTAEREKQLAELRSQGGEAHYYPCDVSNEAMVEALVAQVVSEFGALHGIFHSAGVLRDNYAARKTADEVRTVLESKVRAPLAIDRATQSLPLEIMVLFSSIASFGAVGQLDYAVGNAFLDGFAAERNRQVRSGERSGHTVSVNWPLWKEGGMTPGAFFEAQMLRNLGLTPMPTGVGLEALRVAVDGDFDQVGVATGDAVKLRRFLGIPTEESGMPDHANALGRPMSEGEPSPVHGDGDVSSEVLGALARVLGAEKSSLSMDRELADFGADSVMLTELANDLNGRFGCELQGAAFFELNTPARIVAHLQALRSKSPASSTQASAASSEVAPRIWVPSPLRISVGAEAAGPDRVAIVGFDASFPDAPDAETFWQRVLRRAVSTRRVLPSEWRARGVRLAKGSEKAMEWASLLNGIAAFDASFWGVGELEAKAMDPQQRLLLRSLWRAVEQTGVPWSRFTRNRVGLFVAADSVEYRSVLQQNGAVADLRSGLSPGMLSNRLSYFCNFRGPSETIDTACSSVFVALNRAVQSLRCGECDTAIVAGAKLLLDPSEFQIRHQGDLLSPDGRLCSFDDSARGYVRGEGVGCVILKRLADAGRDGDLVHAVVAGVGVSHNGRRALSSLAPDVEAQCEAMRVAYAAAGLTPDRVGYIEANGAGTHFSDASEMAAYRKFFKETLGPRYERFQCAVSAAKPNVGHLEGASGLPSLLRALFALREATIPATAQFVTPHASMFLKGSPFGIPTETVPWAPAGDGVSRLVALHSIGIGGVNAHVLLEEPPPEFRRAAFREVNGSGAYPESKAEPGPALVVVSAKTLSALHQTLQRWSDWIGGLEDHHEALPLHALARGSRLRLDAMASRAVFVVSSLTELQQCFLDAIREPGLTSEAAGSVGWWRIQARVASTLPRRDPAPTVVGLDSPGLKAVAAAWLNGTYSHWQEAEGLGLRHRFQFPRYPFEDKDFWCDDVRASAASMDSKLSAVQSMKGPLP